jgi:aminoglycoside phosphotransferase (APT) family kinase protein
VNEPSPELAPGLPRAAFAGWLADLLGEPAEPLSAEVISGGLSNVTYRVRAGQHRLVVRRPPLGSALPTAHDMTREYRVLAALRHSAVPVPEVLGFCADVSVIGTDFYVMAESPGQVLRSVEDCEALPVPTRTELARRLVDTLVSLHAVDYASVGLGRHGRPDHYLERQLARWGRQWDSTEPPSPDMRRLRALLAERIPESPETTLVHGDYRLDNLLVLLDPTRVSAVLDWELSTLGDPLADLGMTLTYWSDVGDGDRLAVPITPGLSALPGFPSALELAGMYSRSSGRELTDLGFYYAFGQFKLAVILAGVAARHAEGLTVGGGHERAAGGVPVLVARALRSLDS